MSRMHTHEVDVSDALVRRLLWAQMPELADLELAVVEPWGTDNAIWRLGDDLTVRLPRIQWAIKQVDYEMTWLPRLAPHLAVPIPEPVAVGQPGEGYPYPWGVNRWLPGIGATLDLMSDRSTFADDLATVVRQLHAVPATDAPAARNRARPLADYDASTREYIKSAAHLIDAPAAVAVWDEALSAKPHQGDPVWVHADLEGNCLLKDGKLTGIVDWGSACGGDPAVDIQVVWSPLFDETSRARFLANLDVDDNTLARSKGAAINQACGALPYYLDIYPLIVERSWHKLAALGVDPIA